MSIFDLNSREKAPPLILVIKAHLKSNFQETNKFKMKNFKTSTGGINF